MGRPLLLLERNGKKFFVEYEPIKFFETESEAAEFAKANGITDIELK